MQLLDRRPFHRLAGNTALGDAVEIGEGVDGALDHHPVILQVDVGVIEELAAVTDGHHLLLKGNPFHLQIVFDLLARLGKEMKIDITPLGDGAAEDRADEMGTKLFEQLHLPHSEEAEVEEALRQDFLLIKAEQPLQFLMNLGIGGEVTAERESLLRAVAPRRPALRLASRYSRTPSSYMRRAAS